MRISDWSSDVCSSDLDIDVDPGAVPFDAEFIGVDLLARELQVARFGPRVARRVRRPRECRDAGGILCIGPRGRAARPVERRIVEVEAAQIGSASWRERVGQYV